MATTATLLPLSQGPKKDGICYATQNRQDAVKALAEQCDLVIVVGSPNSRNSRRLKEVAVARGIAGYLIDGPEEIDPAWLQGRQRSGVTARVRSGNFRQMGGRPHQPVDGGGGIRRQLASKAALFPLPQKLAPCCALPEMAPE